MVDILYDSSPQGIDNHGNLVSLLDQPGVKGAKGSKEDFSMLQGTTATGYNRNSMQSFGTLKNNAYNPHWYIRYNTISVNNVSIFNKYVFEKVRKINKDTDAELSELFGDSVYNDAMQNYKDLFNLCLATDSLPKGSYLPFNPPPGGNQIYWHDIDFMDKREAWMENACALYLIGTPEDVEDLSMFPGLIVREVSDETRLFIKDAGSTSILHTQSQLIKYKLETYYDVIPRCARSLKDPTTGLFDDDHLYCERADFQDPILLESISQSYEQQINPDERVYKIYIQMSDDLITTAYERSNFFISIRNSKKKMSIKNFMKYLS